jgi:FG-GAP repeat
MVTRNSRAYVFQRIGTTWQQQAVLTASDDFDGGWVSVSGDYIIVGAPHATPTNIVQGVAYVFARSGSAWIQQAKLEPDAGIQVSEFGSWLAISGDYAVVGAPEEYEGTVRTGAAYIFQRKGTSWLRAEKIIAGDAADGNFFGMPVAIDGSVVGGLAIVGAPEKDVAIRRLICLHHLKGIHGSKFQNL